MPPQLALQALVHHQVEAAKDIGATPLAIHPPQWHAWHMIHQERTSLLAVADRVENDDRQALAFRDQHFSLAPLTAGIKIGADREQRAGAGFASQLDIPIAAGL